MLVNAAGREIIRQRIDKINHEILNERIRSTNMWQGHDNEGCMPGDKERFLKMKHATENESKSLTISPTTITFAKCEWIIDPIAENFIWPKKAEKDSAGWDLFYCGNELRIDPLKESGKVYKVPLGFRAKISNGWCAQLLMRSGLALKYNLGLSNSVGLIDGSFRQEWCALVINRSNDFYYLRSGTAIVQVLFEPVYTIGVQRWDGKDEWNDSDRKDGFGHSGHC